VDNRVLRLAWCVGTLTVLLTGAAYAWIGLHSNFRAYDDEGQFLLATLFILQGHAPYVDFQTPYGPVWFGFKWLLHGLLGIDLNHGSIRMLTLVMWLSLALLGAALVRQISGSRWWAVAAFALLVLSVRAFVNEPGHPQDIIACLVLLAVAAGGLRNPPVRWLALGLLCALVINIKVNAGLFLLAACLCVVAARLPGSLLARIVQWAMVIASAAAPLVLMAPHLDREHCLALALICASATTATGLSLLSQGQRESRDWLPLPALALGLSLGVALAWLLLGVLGGNIASMVNNIAAYARGQETYFFFREFSSLQLLAALASPVVALLVLRDREHALARTLVLSGKPLFAVVTLFTVFWHDASNAQLVLAWAAPWSWLCIVQVEEDLSGPARSLLAAIAAWQLLLVYPVPGSQLYFGLFPVSLAALVCLADSAREVVALRRMVGPMVALGIVVLLGMSTLRSYQHYKGLVLLDLPGTGELRLQEGTVRNYRRLSAALDDADVAFITNGFNSLFFWSNAQPAAIVVVTHTLSFLGEEEQRRLRDGLARTERPVVVQVGDRGQAPDLELLKWIDATFTPVQKIGRFQLMQPAAGAHQEN
jgi:hypothetical protein